jgi:hypothetical protein
MNTPLPAIYTSRAARGVTYQSPDDHAFFSIMAIAAICAIVAGFSRTYYLAFLTGGPPIPIFVHIHAATFTLWLGLYLAQTQLIAHHRVDIHRRLGKAGALLCALMLIVGTITAITAAKHGYRGVPGQLFEDSEGFLIVPLRDIAVFSTLVAAGLYLRSNVAAHKRLMQTAVIGGLLPPGTARLPVVHSIPSLIGVVLLLFLLAGPLYDLIHFRRVHPAYIWGGLLSFLTLAPMLEPIALTQTWHGAARWLMGAGLHFAPTG